MNSLPPLKLTPAQLKDSQATGIIAGNLTVAILATFAVAFRLLARHLQKVVFGYDDYCVLLALVRLAVVPDLTCAGADALTKALWVGHVRGYYLR